MSGEKVRVIIVPHTHWDREWYLPFEEFRAKLVGLMDMLIELLDKDPRFRCFTLDGQSVIVEDYLEIRPEKSALLKRLVANNRLLIGPWYTSTEEFLVSPESLIRNLLLGREVAMKYGGVMLVGYLPDTFGHIAQLPQILRGFSIGSFVFARGLGDEGEKLKTEFLWEAPDGSTVLAIHLLKGYSNAKKIPSDPRRALEFISHLKDELLPHSTGNYVLVMNGGDHTLPQENMPDIVEKLNEIQKEMEISIGGLEDYIRIVRSGAPKYDVYRGELRGARYRTLLPGVLSTRMYLKQMNWRTQMMLENFAEPLAVFAWLLGFDYPQNLIREAWRLLLQNHAHDSIYGCGVDEVHDENVSRYERVRQIAESVIQEAVKEVSSRIKTSIDKPLTSIIVFNTLNWPRTDIVDVTIRRQGAEDFELKDTSGKTIPYQIIHEEDGLLKLCFIAEDVPPCGYKTYTITKALQKPVFHTALKVTETSIQNEFFRVYVDPENGGSLRVEDLRTGRVFKELNLIEDGGDAGDEYNYSPPENNMIITSRREPAKVEVIERGPVKATIRVSLTLKLPKSLSEDRKSRGLEVVDCPVESRVTLYAGVPRIDIETTVRNNAKDHRLRVLFPTGLKTDYVYADSHFYVIRRSVQPPRGERWVEKPSTTHPQLTFIDVSDGEVGLMIANRGIPEYEALADEDGVTVALTLLRCVGWLSLPDLPVRRELAGPMIETPKAQCLGDYAFNYSIIPHEGDWLTSKAYIQAKQFNVPLHAVEVGVHEGDLPPELSFLSIAPESLILSALKRAEREGGLIARFYNIEDKEVEAKIKSFTPHITIWMTNLNEDRLERLKPVNGEVTLNVGAHKIITLLIKCERPPKSQESVVEA